MVAQLCSGVAPRLTLEEDIEGGTLPGNGQTSAGLSTIRLHYQEYLIGRHLQEKKRM